MMGAKRLRLRIVGRPHTLEVFEERLGRVREIANFKRLFP